jgi:hypothetical protein
VITFTARDLAKITHTLADDTGHYCVPDPGTWPLDVEAKVISCPCGDIRFALVPLAAEREGR